MAHSVPMPPPGFDELSVEEKLAYLDSLWDRIAAGSAAVPVPAWHRAVVRERLAEHEREPDDVSSWPESGRLEAACERRALKPSRRSPGSA